MEFQAESNHNNHATQPGASGLNPQDTQQQNFYNTEPMESGNLNKVRDILFGKQMRDYDTKFARLEERLVQECTQLREESLKRLDALEIYIKKEVASLEERLKNEQSERSDAVTKLVQEHRDTTAALEIKLAQFNDQTSQTSRELRQQLLDQSKNLHDDIRQKYEEMLALLEREAQDLRVQKTDRAALATLFADMAVRLNSK